MKKFAVPLFVLIVAIGAGAQVAQQVHLFWGIVVAFLTILFGLMAFAPISRI
ncbi:MAG: hypothetical protein WD940_01540 [Patescibacteria group bacterium]